MREAFLHYIWQYQYFEKEGLSTINGEVLTIQNSGFLNLDAGPDFLQGKVLLDHIQWQGSIEIHVRSLDWKLHAHSKDKAYDNVILHVVWEDNGPVYRSDNSLIPTLELKKRVDLQLIEKYEKLVHAPNTQIPCERMFAKTPDIIKLDMLDRMASERLVAKARNIDEIRKRNNGDWEETVYQTLARSYGLKINAQTFERLSNLMPFRIIRKHSHSLFELEA